MQRVVRLGSPACEAPSEPSKKKRHRNLADTALAPPAPERSLRRTGPLARPSHLRRRPAKLVQHPLAQSLGIALAGLCKIHDPPCQHFVGEVAAISKPKCDQGHFKCEAHDPDRLRVELVAI